MFRNILFIFSASIIWSTSVAQQTDVDNITRSINADVCLSKEKVTQFIFPEAIEKWRGGFDTEIFVKDVYNNILYLQPLASFPTSNLHVITVNGISYSINIHYADSVCKTTYIYTDLDATFTPTTNKTNSPTTPSATTPPHHTASPSEPLTAGTTVEQVLSERDFLSNRSGVRYRNLSFRITGIYYEADKLYFKCKVSNSTNIPYEFDYIGFSLETRKRNKTTTSNTEELLPIETYYESMAVTSAKEISCVFVLQKFTIGNDNTLAISIVEKDGGRNMILTISDDLLLQAKNISNVK